MCVGAYLVLLSAWRSPRALAPAPRMPQSMVPAPWVKGYTDIFGGILPPQPGVYVRNDAYHYEGEVGARIFDGNVQLGVEERYLADILALTYVTPWKILGGTYAVAVAPSIVQMNVDVGATRAEHRGHRGKRSWRIKFDVEPVAGRRQIRYVTGAVLEVSVGLV